MVWTIKLYAKDMKKIFAILHNYSLRLLVLRLIILSKLNDADLEHDLKVFCLFLKMLGWWMPESLNFHLWLVVNLQGM